PVRGVTVPDLRGAVDVWVTPDQLVGGALERVRQRGAAPLGEQLHAADRKEREVAELLRDRLAVSGCDRLARLDGLFREERCRRFERLLAVPRAAIGAAEPTEH